MVHDTRTMLVLSTGHVSKKTAKFLDEADYRAEAKGVRFYPSAGGVWSYGWLIYVGDPETWPTDCLPDTSLLACASYANKAGFQYILFDRDGNLVDELPHYDW
jgi:hypothetical protein